MATTPTNPERAKRFLETPETAGRVVPHAVEFPDQDKSNHCCASCTCGKDAHNEAKS